jgi:hypothetical protein
MNSNEREAVLSLTVHFGHGRRFEFEFEEIVKEISGFSKS